MAPAVIVTVLNEQETIAQLVEALRHQTLPAAEIIIVDGGSKDATWQILSSLAKRWPVLKIYSLPNSNRSVARNHGVSKSKSPIIAFTDAGCIPHTDWLEHLVTHFSNRSTQVVSGYYQGIAQNVFQKCLIPYVLVMKHSTSREFLPSTRSMAIRRQSWDKAGGFNPQLSHNEDYAYAHRLKKIGLKFTFTPKAIVDWIPRKNLYQAAIMFFRFALGDAQAAIIRPKVILLLTRYFLAIILFILIPQILILLVPCYLSWSIWKNYKYVRHPQAIIWLPTLQITSDIAIVCGTIIGILTK